jgi:hypothetical protein
MTGWAMSPEVVLYLVIVIVGTVILVWWSDQD